MSPNNEGFRRQGKSKNIKVWICNCTNYDAIHVKHHKRAQPPGAFPAPPACYGLVVCYSYSSAERYGTASEYLSTHAYHGISRPTVLL